MAKGTTKRHGPAKSGRRPATGTATASSYPALVPLGLGAVVAVALALVLGVAPWSGTLGTVVSAAGLPSTPLSALERLVVQELRRSEEPAQAIERWGAQVDWDAGVPPAVAALLTMSRALFRSR